MKEALTAKTSYNAHSRELSPPPSEQAEKLEEEVTVNGSAPVTNGERQEANGTNGERQEANGTTAEA